jgi:hypothetical protein
MAAAPWLAGLVLAVVVLGPALGPGSLLNLDLVFAPTIPVPRGVWALGPELSRRVPLGVMLAWISSAVSGPVAGKLLLLASLIVAFAGAWRLVGDFGVLTRLGAGVLYAASPFTLTRVGVGHWAVVAAIAVLPWALPVLLRPSDDLRRTWLWSVALGATGITGGMFAAALLASGLVAERGRNAIKVGVVFAVAQLPWAVPGIFTVGTVGRLSASRHFATNAPLPWGPLRVLAGGGFWRIPSQVGARGAGGALLGGALLALAILGAGRLPAEWRRRAQGAAAVGLALALASALPGVRAAYAALTDTTVGASLRDGQRLLALFLVWVAPAAAIGATRLAVLSGPALQPTLEALPVVAGAVLAAPALWGVAGALEPATFPAGWAQARAQVHRAPGPVLALPWHEYLDLHFAGDRRVLNPVPDYFGGDVIVSSDPELGDRPPRREQGDPREPHVPALLDHLQDASRDLKALGVRWVVLLHEVDWERYRVIGDDAGMERTLTTSTLDLYRVREWRGPVVDDSGKVVDARTSVAPLSRVAPSGNATWTRPGAAGWLRGTAGTGTTAEGLLRLPAGRGPVWYWPAALALGADALVVGAVVVAVVRGRQRRISRNADP